MGKKTVAKKKAKKPLIVDIMEVIIPAIILYFILSTWVVQTRVVPSGSMEPTIMTGERFLANKFIFWFRSPRRGEIVVFKPPAEINQKYDFVKRVIGLPGETVELLPGKVLINGRPLNEPYVAPDNQIRYLDPAARFNGPYRIPAGCYFLMGDNRKNSEDSRYFGAIPLSDFRGLGFWRFWPPWRMGKL
ncbi:MAG: signal peptidase I [Bacillota bacterium]